MTKNKNKKYSKDHFYCNGILVNKFVNLLTDNGKKSYKYKLLLKSLNIGKFKILSKNPKVGKTDLRREQGVHNKRPIFGLEGTYFNFKESFIKGASSSNKQTDFVLPENAHGSKVQAPLGVNPPNEWVGPGRGSHPNIGALTTLRSQKCFEPLSGRVRGISAQNKVGKITLENNYNGSASTQKVAFEINKLLLFYQAVGNVKPSVETRKVRVGGAIYQVPCIIQKFRQEGIAMRWLIMSAFIKKRSTFLSFSNCLSQEFLDCIKKEGQSLQKRDQIHNLAVNNRAYARYRWW